MNNIKVCIVGTGQFAQCFIPLFKAHPLVQEISLCEIVPERLRTEQERFGVPFGFSSFEEALRSDVDAVAIFTLAPSHAPLALQALRAGKHVYASVPAATTLEELHDLTEIVRTTGLTYMMGETSLYYGSRLYCMERWEAGDFGRFVYGEGEYYHDMSHGLYEAYQFRGGRNWKSMASYPPMLYPTHSIAMVLSVTGKRMTSVSCLGYADQHDDGVFREEISEWKNPFSNQTGLFRTSDGGMVRINEFRRIGQSGGRSVRASLYGTEGSFEENSAGALWASRTAAPVDVENRVKCGGVHNHEQWEAVKVDVALRGDFTSGFGEVHQKYRSRLPDVYRTQPNGHEGSHQFLIDDFVSAVVQGIRPSCDIWDAARYNAPGIVAHESAKREGEPMSIPDFGTAPR